jgi:hypothetical protein
VDRQQRHQHGGNETQSNHGATAESDKLLPAAAARKAFIGFRNSKTLFIGRSSRSDQPSTSISALCDANIQFACVFHMKRLKRIDPPISALADLW